MSRHTTFRFCLDPTAEQSVVLARHAGAARFGFNQCLRLHLEARRAHRRDAAVVVPWSGFDLINAFNAWKTSPAAGRVIAVDSSGRAEVVSVGLVWRSQVSQQVFEEAAVNLGRGLRAWTDSRRAHRSGARVGYPRWKKKTRSTPSFRLRNKQSGAKQAAIRVGETYPRSVTLPTIGRVRVREDTRRLRRLIRTGRGRVLFAAVLRRAGRWWVSVTVEAADLHPGSGPGRGDGGWVGIDRGLHAWLVAATGDGREVARVGAWPRALARGMPRQRRLSRAVSRKQPGSNNRAEASDRLRRHHAHVANVRRHFIHQVTNRLVQTHDRLVLEDLNITGMLANHRLARSISDAAWAELARQLRYKQAWKGGQVLVADRWFPSTKICSSCALRHPTLPLAERTYRCNGCGLQMDRDLNAAANLAAWAEDQQAAHERDTIGNDARDARARDPQAAGPANNAHRQHRAGHH